MLIANVAIPLEDVSSMYHHLMDTNVIVTSHFLKLVKEVQKYVNPTRNMGVLDARTKSVVRIIVVDMIGLTKLEETNLAVLALMKQMKWTESLKP